MYLLSFYIFIALVTVEALRIDLIVDYLLAVVLPFFSIQVLTDDSNATSNSKMKRAILAPSLNVKLSDEHQLYSTMEDCVGKN